MIPFNKPCSTGEEEQHVKAALSGDTLAGDGEFSRKCQKWFENRLGCSKALLTPSCTHALEMAALLIGTKSGDEVIMPSYTFVSTANAFVLRGATIRFVDIDPETMNIDAEKIEAAITDRTIAIVAVHYAGIACDMDTIMQLADKHGLFVIEDAAQAITSKYQGKPLGSIGHLGTFSFHETKNITSGGEGGLLAVNSETMSNRSEVIRDKGTDRSSFLRGEVNKYRWIDFGSSYLMNDLSAAYLWGQLTSINRIQQERLRCWSLYRQELQDISALQLPSVPEFCEHNAHIVYLKLDSSTVRSQLIEYLARYGILAVFHYVPLHSAPAGKRFGKLVGDDVYTTTESDRLLRLPLYYGLLPAQISTITSVIREFFS
ncbi:MAG: dTDP-4-amino-4,6-dideoxygalactose transaminase [Granulosicoccus sp.]|nr:dTDP-4-amino-4,6-dideoxygalactose transaminase [Granulosicoccus sp.]